jgi:energy-coupling factor transporter ATP-binding protein EcfA2
MPLVEVTSLNYRYPDGTQALADVSFALEDGECVGLVGPNGAGKSTLLWHLNGLLPAHPPGRGRRSLERAGQGRGGQGDAAAVRIAGLVTTGSNLPTIRRLVGLVFQDPDDQLFCPTVREDVAFGPLNLGLDVDEVLRRVSGSLAAVGLSGFEDRVPHHLSIGQRRRVCLAGVLACDPGLLAIDEPTANLDPRARRQLMRILVELPCAKLIASHDLEMVLNLCSRVIVLDEGRIQADGPTREILGDEELLMAHGLELPASLRGGHVF